MTAALLTEVSEKSALQAGLTAQFDSERKALELIEEALNGDGTTPASEYGTQIVAVMTGHQSQNVRAAAAEFPDLSDDLQLKLAVDKSPYVRRHLAANDIICDAAQEILAKDPDPLVKEALAGNLNLSEEIQLYFANNHDTGIGCALAANPNLCEAAQNELAQYVNVFVTPVLAANPVLSEDLQMHYATRGIPSAKVALAGNSSLTAEAREKLEQDGGSEVIEALRNRDAGTDQVGASIPAEEFTQS